MTLEDVQLPITYEWGIAHAMLFSDSLCQRLFELHADHGRPDCRATPVRTTDGRWFLTADILKAAEPGGYLYAMWQAADKSVLLPGVEVVPVLQGMALLPVRGAF